MALIAGVLMCALVLLVCADVGARYFQLFAMPWSLDMAEHSLYVVTFFGAPWVLREQGHIAVDILVQALSPRPRRAVDKAAYVIGAVTCAVLFYYSVRVWWRSFEAGNQVHRTFVFPEWWLMVIAPPVFLMLLAIFLRWIVSGPPQRKSEADAALSDGL